MKADKNERHLAKIWLMNIAFFLLLFIAQIIGNKYGPVENVLKVISWATAILLPPGAVVFSLFYSRMTSKDKTFQLNSKYYKYSKWLTIYFFVVFWSVMLVSPFVRSLPFEFYAMSSVILLPLQAFLILNLCMLLATRQELTPLK